MPTMPSTDVSGLLAAAGDGRSVIAATLLPDAGSTLCHRLGLGDGHSARQALAARLQGLGVREVFWDDSLMDAQIHAEARELANRMEAGAGLPLLLSGCSGWYRSAEKELAACFTVLPPHMRCRGLAIRSLLSARLGVPFGKIIHVTVVGCPAQKERYSLFRDDPALCIGEEYVITARELALWLGLGAALPVSPAPSRSEVAQSASSGRLERVLRETCRLLGREDIASFSLSPLPACPALQTGEIRINGKSLCYAQMRGLHEAPRLIRELQSGRWRFDLLEVLACAGCR